MFEISRCQDTSPQEKPFSLVQAGLSGRWWNVLAGGGFDNGEGIGEVQQLEEFKRVPIECDGFE